MRVRGPAGVDGFTMVDVIVGVFILAVGILGLSATVGVVGKNMREAHRDTRLATFAQAEMERLLALGYVRLEPGVRAQGAYRAIWQVDGADPKEVLLVVEHAVNGEIRADTLATLVHRPRE